MKTVSTGSTKSKALSLKLAIRLLGRDWRAGELRILISALIIAVAATTAIGFFTDRIQRGLVRQSAEILGADLALVGNRPAQPAWLQAATARDIRLSRTLEFTSVILHADKLQLSSVKAVDKHFPLRGQMRTATGRYTEDTVSTETPPAGEVWAEARFLNRLGVELGQTIAIGALDLKLTRVLTFEPGRVGNVFAMSPRVLMNLDDVAATAVVQPGSRVSYQYLFAGPEPAIDAYRNWIKPRLGEEFELLGVRDGRRSLGAALERAGHYLGLAVLVAVILAGVAIGMAARGYSERHFDLSAMLRCLGSSQGDLLRLYLPQLAIVGVVASLAGCALGWLAQYGLFFFLRDLLPATPGGVGLKPALAGMATGLVVLAGFALPPVLRLRQVPPLRVLRRELVPLPASAWLVYGLALCTIAVLLWTYTGSWKMVNAMFGGIVAAIAVLALLAAALLAVGRRLNRGSGVAWRLGFSHLLHRSRASIGQILAFALTLMAMAVVGLVRTDLLTNWRAQLPEDAPNHFLINILPDQVNPVRDALKQANVGVEQIYPMIRGRLVTINRVPVRQAVSKESRATGAIHRSLNLTWSTELQKDNKIVSGSWWSGSDIGKPKVSVEARLATRLGIQLGDELGFTIGGEGLTAHVSSLRTVQWDSFRPNFYMIFPPGVLDQFAATYITSFFLPPDKKPLLLSLIRSFPSLTVLEMDLIMNQVKRIVQQVSLAVEYVLVFVLLAGFTVLFAALRASLDERLYEGALLRALGASRAQLRAGHLTEFVTLGLMAGLIAAIGTECITWLLYTQVFNLDYSLSWPVWLITPLVGGILIGAAGFWGTRPVLNQSPLTVFRRI